MIPEAENLVFDRSHADTVFAADLIARALRYGFESLAPDEQALFHAGLKGRYTVTDLNRVETAVAAVAAILRSRGRLVSVTTKAWVFNDIPSPFEMGRYLENVKTLMGAFFVLPSTPELPDDMELLAFGGANDIERILYDISQLIDNMVRTVDLGWALGLAHTGVYGGL